jgi:hypothetical protein
MPRVITFDKGSKRGLNKIRWKLIEVFSLALLAVLVFALSLLVMLWELQHENPNGAPTRTKEIRRAEPAPP